MSVDRPKTVRRSFLAGEVSGPGPPDVRGQVAPRSAAQVLCEAFPFASMSHPDHRKPDPAGQTSGSGLLRLLAISNPLRRAPGPCHLTWPACCPWPSPAPYPGRPPVSRQCLQLQASSPPMGLAKIHPYCAQSWRRIADDAAYQAVMARVARLSESHLRRT